MPDIETTMDAPPNRRSFASVELSDIGTARATREPSSRLTGAFWRFVDAVRERAAEIMHGEEDTSDVVAHVYCDTCIEYHPVTEQCVSRAVGFCGNCGRRRLLYKSACAKCGSKHVTEIVARWAVTRGGR